MDSMRSILTSKSAGFYKNFHLKIVHLEKNRNRIRIDCKTHVRIYGDANSNYFELRSSVGKRRSSSSFRELHHFRFFFFRRDIFKTVQQKESALIL